MLQELVEFYQQNELSDSFPEVNTTLVHPYKTISGHAGEYSPLFVLVSRGAGDLYPNSYSSNLCLSFKNPITKRNHSYIKHHHHYYPHVYTESLAYCRIFVFLA